MPPQGAPMPPQGAPMPPVQQGGGFSMPPAQQMYQQPPMRGGQGYYPPADQSQYGGAQMPPPQEDNTPANFQLGTKLPLVLKIKAPASDLNYNEDYFVRLLAGSISLSKDEKKRIIDSIPSLKQEQIDELTRIFEEEKQKFAALSAKHVPQLEKLAQQHYDEWMQLEDEVAMSSKKQEDTSKADEIRKNLGL